MRRPVAPPSEAAAINAVKVAKVASGVDLDWGEIRSTWKAGEVRLCHRIPVLLFSKTA